LAGAVAAGEIRLDGSVSLDQLLASLTLHGGLDRSTAQYVALRLGESDAFPATDPMIDRTLPKGRRARAALRADEVERWRPWRAVAATHLLLAHEPLNSKPQLRGAA
jgi:AraC family transcriptional regulator of adaptative response / DNA-3-methyladenine glycosylase II